MTKVISLVIPIFASLLAYYFNLPLMFIGCDLLALYLCRISKINIKPYYLVFMLTTIIGIIANRFLLANYYEPLWIYSDFRTCVIKFGIVHSLLLIEILINLLGYRVLFEGGL